MAMDVMHPVMKRRSSRRGEEEDKLTGLTDAGVPHDSPLEGQSTWDFASITLFLNHDVVSIKPTVHYIFSG